MRRCDDCGAFLANEPTETVSVGWSFGETEADHCYEVDEIRVCCNGHENVERTAA